jgi:DNA-binding transcriptional MerR regulator
MGVLDQVSKFKDGGMQEDEIVKRLQDQGVSPREIKDALNQTKIKEAVSNEQYDEELPPEGMEPSIMKKVGGDGDGIYIPQTHEVQEDYYNPAPAPQQEEQYSDQGQYQQQPQQDYYQGGGYQDTGYSGGYGTDTIMEIAEQVFSEKIKKIQKQVEDMNEFKILTQTKVETSLDRLKKIESTIDQLQIAILKKVGSYGTNLEEIQKEMSMMQESFGKIINTVADKRERTTIHEQEKSAKKPKSKK